jgi:hypothetical protein
VADPQQVARQRRALFVEGLPLSSTSPAVGCISPANRRSRLVLPLPLGPLICTMSPLASRNSRFSNSSRKSRSQAERNGFQEGLVKGSRAFTVQVGGAVAVKEVHNNGFGDRV